MAPLEKGIHVKCSNLLDARLRAAADWCGVTVAGYVKQAVTEALNVTEAKRARIEKNGNEIEI